MKPIPTLERRDRLFLIGVGGHQRGIDIDDQRRLGVDTVIGRAIPSPAHAVVRAADRAQLMAANAFGASAANAVINRDTVG